MLFAMGDLRNWQDAHPSEVEIADGHMSLSHDAAASLSARSAAALGLPGDVDLVLRTDATGSLGRPDFRLDYEWKRNGRRETPRRQGAFLHTRHGARRVPLWMKRALDLADNFDAAAPLEDHWRALAEFRRAIDPDETGEMPENRDVAALAMTPFLRGLEVRLADRFSISPVEGLSQFEVVPYSGRSLDGKGVGEAEVAEGDAELSGEALAAFQYGLRRGGAKPAYSLGGNSYLVVDPGAAPVLQEIVRAQKADRDERKEFISNPRAFITDAVSRHLEASGAFEGLDDAAQEELTASVAGPALIESREYSERVTGTVEYRKPAQDYEGSGTTWLPEVFGELVAGALKAMPDAELDDLQARMKAALGDGAAASVAIAGEEVPVTPETVAAVEAETLRRSREAEDETPVSPDEGDEERAGPVILETLDNFEELTWHQELRPRVPAVETALPSVIATPLREHQLESFRWALDAWQKGLPGILNADEQGLGKTLQTIAFLAWLQSHMQVAGAAPKGPILVVAPTSLLRNWEQEVETHVAPRKFGTLVRLYGSSLSSHKRRGTRGTETASGLPHLDLDWLEEAVGEGRAHRYWILTTYTTLANYQHSLGRIPFAAMVMDEIQNIKNRATIASKAAEAMNADFRIGLTGTPIENATIDLWTIMDRIAPGSLGSGAEFRSRYGTPDEGNMDELHARVFRPAGSCPPLGLRRLKDEVAKDLPQKSRFLHPQLMPQIQADAYEEARRKLAEGGMGAQLKMLHHIRSVSVHPGIGQDLLPDDFVKLSARLDATIAILRRIAGKGERALVFIEHRDMQFRFAELLRHFFGLERVDIINGDTPIPRRQEIVTRFQRHLQGDQGFDVLVLGPRAAGTGLTLTAATHVIHLSRWWNPAVEEQCNDRVHRIGQARPVEVHVPMAIHPRYGASSFDGLLQSLMQRKRRLAQKALWPMGDTGAEVAALQASLGAEMAPRDGSLEGSMAELFRRDSMPGLQPDANGAYRLP
ncbi:DEAD/DEAH box helicase [Mangrovicoccus sp. HB161399]|uniref:DEAD/DEAH box helicase n=1 Tax=Mangrovicoccus sp. HB161399 TaxID=2720392 RepID=UPI001556CEFD|nr:DEAD/DEAH box helicase [Mangrovicoccus sp. HB161399]